MSDAGESIRLGDWLAKRTPLPPSQLMDRVKQLAGDATCARVDLPAVLVDLAVSAIRGVGADRQHAVDLLAADALITYAMDAAVELGEVDKTGVAAMERISRAFASETASTSTPPITA